MLKGLSVNCFMNKHVGGAIDNSKPKREQGFRSNERLPGKADQLR